MALSKNYIEKVFEFINEKSVGSLKEPFLKSLSTFLANLLEVEYVLIDKYTTENPGIVETVVFYHKNKFLPNISYELSNTPCHNVLNKKLCSYPTNIQKLFPKDEMLVTMNVESYIGLPLWSANGVPIGLIAILDTKEIKNVEQIKTVLQIVGLKVAQVLEKIIFEAVFEKQMNQLKESKDKFRNIVENTNEWFFEIDKNGVFTYSTSLVENIAGFTSKEIIGKSVFNFIIYPVKKVASQFFNEAMNQKTIWKNILLKIPHKNGSFRYIESNASPILDNQGIIKGFRGINRDITEQKIAEKEMKKLSMVVNQSANAVIITDTEGAIEYVNQKFINVSGYTYDEVIGKNPRILNSGTQPKEFFTLLWETINDGKIWQGKFQNKAKNGSLFWEETTITPIKNIHGEIQHFLAIKQDISELKLAEKKLQLQNTELTDLSNELSEKNRLLLDSKNRFVNLFEQNPVSLWEEDFTSVKQMIAAKNLKKDELKLYLDNNPDFVLDCLSKIKIINVNAFTLKLLGASSKEELIQNLGANFTKKSLNTFKEELVAIISNQKSFVKETELKRIDGKILTVIIKLAFVNENNIVIVSMVDISGIKKAGEKLKLQNVKLLKAKEEAEESNRLKTEFLNNMSHEIRTPMNGILGFSQLLANNDLTVDKRSHFINIIQNSGHQLMHIIDDLLEISRLGTKQVKVYETEVCLNDLFFELFSIFDNKAKDKKLPLYVKKGLSDSESTIFTDSLKLNKILGNLLENAFKFTNKGFIEFGYYRKNKDLEIYVKDTGIGVKEEKHELIFERFSQAEKDLSKNVGGLGLGLSIAKENTELLGGKISIKSAMMKGSTFFVTIPYKPVHESSSTNFDEFECNNQLKTTLLIVEDEEVNYLYLEMLLMDSLKINCTILHAKNGEEAVAFCKTNSSISLILMDLKMPVMNGFTATEIIKKMSPTIPIIAQTAYSTAEDKQKAFNAGCDDFISKPITKNLMIDMINKYTSVLNL